jgi:hypothetical protein
MAAVNAPTTLATTLPSELLRGIFHLATPYKDAGTILSRQRLLLVCRAFHAVASRDPTFWADLDLLWPEQASWLLARAGSAPLRVHLRDAAEAYAESRYHAPLTGRGFLARLTPRVERLWLRLVADHAARVESLEFAFEWHASYALGFLNWAAEGHAPAATFAQLSRIHVNLRVPDEGQQYIQGLFVHDFPALRDLQLGHCVLDMSHLMPQNLKTVHLTGPMYRHIPLRHMPDLVCLTMDIFPSVIPEEKVVLATLQHMSLQAQVGHGSGQDIVRFVDQIEAPSLRMLEVECADAIDPVASFERFIDDAFLTDRGCSGVALTSVQRMSFPGDDQCHTFRLQSSDRSLSVWTRIAWDAPPAPLFRNMKLELRAAVTSIRVGSRAGRLEDLWVEDFTNVTVAHVDQRAARALFRVWATNPAYMSKARALNICGRQGEAYSRLTLDLGEMQAALDRRAHHELRVYSISIAQGPMVITSGWKRGLEEIGVDIVEEVVDESRTEQEMPICTCR